MAEPLTITAAAAEAIRSVMDSQSVPADHGLRVGMRGGGCGGMGYILGFDTKKETDLEYEVAGMRVIIERAHSMYVLGMEIDWHSDDQQQGFVFNNPKERAAAENAASESQDK